MTTNSSSSASGDQVNNMVAVFPTPPPVDLARTLDLAGYRWKAAASGAEAAKNEPTEGWAGAVVMCDDDPEGGWAFCRSLRKRDVPVRRVLVMVSGAQLPDLSCAMTSSMTSA